MVVTVRINEDKDSDICKFLSGLSGPERAEYVRQAIRFYINMGQIEQRLENIEKSLADLTKNGLVNNTNTVKNEPSDLSSSKKKILNGINSIFNM